MKLNCKWKLLLVLTFNFLSSGKKGYSEDANGPPVRDKS